MTSFLYRLRFSNGKSYIGIAKEPYDRFTEHKRQARSGSILPVHRAIRKYPLVQLEIITYGSRQRMAALEKLAIRILKTRSHEHGYNIRIGGDGGTLGLKLAATTRLRMSLSHKGKHQTAEWVEKLATARRGQKRSMASRARMSVGQKKRIRTPAELARMKDIAKLRIITPEYREHMRLAALHRCPRSKVA